MISRSRAILSRVPSFDCYKTLGLGRRCSESEIKTAYRVLVKQHHPDVNGGKSSSRFIEIQQAYETLTERREEHDSTHPDKKPQTNWTPHTKNSWWSENFTDPSEDFEEIWRRMKSRHFRSDEDDRNRQNEDGRNRQRRKTRFSTETGKTSDPESKPGILKVESEISWMIGTFLRISDFNGRAAYEKSGKKFPVFLFWSRKFGDWKFHRRLKDEDTCLAFNEDGQKFPTNLRSAWIVHRRGHWEKSKVRISGERSDDQKVKQEISTWTVEELKSYLTESGQAVQAAQCVEKKELIDLVVAIMNNSETSDIKIEIASRAHMGSAVELPTPSLSRKCRLHGNRVEHFGGGDVADWILKHGNRLRYYGVFEDKKFQYGLVWANNKEWQRVYVQHVRKPLKDE